MRGRPAQSVRNSQRMPATRPGSITPDATSSPAARHGDVVVELEALDGEPEARGDARLRFAEGAAHAARDRARAALALVGRAAEARAGAARRASSFGCARGYQN